MATPKQKNLFGFDEKHLLLTCGDATQVLERIVPNDPLGLRVLVVRELLRRSLLYDVEELLVRSFAIVAYRSTSWRGEPPLRRFLGDAVAEAITILESPGQAGGEAFTLLSRSFELEADGLQQACALFNHLPRRERERFLEVVLGGRSAEERGREEGLSLPALCRSLRGILDLLVEAADIPD